MKMKKLICTWRAWLRAAPGLPVLPAPEALGLEGTGPRRAAQPQARAPASVLAACRPPSRSAQAGCCLPPWPPALQAHEEGAGGQPHARPEEPQARRFLTTRARKTGTRRIHQKPMLSLLVQHLQGGRTPLSAPARPQFPADLISDSGKTPILGTRFAYPQWPQASDTLPSAPQNWRPPRRHQERGAGPSSRSRSYSLDVLEQTLHHRPGDDEQHGGACRGRQLWSKLPRRPPTPRPRPPAAHSPQPMPR